MMNEKKYCSACGAELDSEGICSREGCPRRAIQLRLKAAQDAALAAEKAKGNDKRGE